MNTFYEGYVIVNSIGHYLIYINNVFVESADTITEAKTIIDNLIYNN